MPDYVDVGVETIRTHRRITATSLDAFDVSKVHHKSDEAVVYGYICASPNGLTSKEVANLMKKHLHAISGRITSLKDHKKIRVTGARRDGADVLMAVTDEQQSLGLGDAA